MYEKLEKITELKNNLICCLDSVMANGISQVDTEEAGEVIDMIKDLAEAEKCCMESMYYESVIGAMDEYEGNERAGYNTRRYSNGRYAPAGKGTRMGYHNVNAPYYIDKYMNDSHDGNSKWEEPEYGHSYANYQNAKRHYTETKSISDKNEMDMNAEKHINETVSTMKDIWASADMNLKRKMKNDLSNLLAEMNV